ncbi:MAG: alkane 1-monooxygenase [Rhodobacteraceae bacterium]|nr:MAG: alkane 1-monooxygenase [Paracoccaceae bacterium]
MPVLPFAFAAIAPVVLLGAGAFWGGLWAVVALAYVSALAFAADTLITRRLPDAEPEEVERAANRLSVLIALAHFALMGLGVAALAGATGLGLAERVAVFFAFGLYFGQVSIANAHELIHRSDRRLFRLGKWVFISMLYGHVTTSHRLLHHAHVATPKDPNFPPLGMSFYRYLPRSLALNLVESFRLERDRAARSGRITPFVSYIGGALAFLALAGLAFGGAGVVALAGFAAYAQFQHAMVDYLQHYGLARRQLPDGRYEPQGPQHSWNSPHWFTSLMAVNVTRHSDHHAHPGRIYPALRLTPQMPVLPYSLPAMGVIALVPRLWFRMMDKRVARVLATAEGDPG